MGIYCGVGQGSHCLYNIFSNGFSTLLQRNFCVFFVGKMLGVFVQGRKYIYKKKLYWSLYFSMVWII